MINWKDYESAFNTEVEPIIEWMQHEFGKLRMGRATPAILDGILVEAYGEEMPIIQVANISIPDARTLIIKPYDKSILKDLAGAINGANLGVNPQVDADLIRITFAAPTEAARKDLVKKAKSISEDAKVKVRRARQDIQDLFKKDATAVEDDKKYFQTQLDTMTKAINKDIEEALAKREKEIMTI
ncbi:ribosome recycling factor [Ureaplasma ceti]|uniref:Ribosome-recycling factor n=1 Tax=Ureaplasma ceti TaxID=3119530 RepID=A0ABP9U6X3_9BACT